MAVRRKPISEVCTIVSRGSRSIKPWRPGPLGKVISDRKRLFDYDKELTLVTMKRYKEIRLSEFFSKICDTSSAVTVSDSRNFPTGYAIDFTDVHVGIVGNNHVPLSMMKAALMNLA